MIVRIVKMSFKADKIHLFLKTFEKQKAYIQNFEGCSYLELLRDTNDPKVFFTYSHWENESYLNSYRNSDFFKTIWSKVKLYFDDRPKAWSTEIVTNSNEYSART